MKRNRLGENWWMVIIIAVTWLVAALTIMSGRSEKKRISGLEKKIVGYEIFVVSKPRTRVWCLARRCNPGQYDTREVVDLVLKKNPQIDKTYDLRVGDTILLPVLKSVK